MKRTLLPALRICLLLSAIVPQFAFAQDPGWQVNSSEYQFNMNVTASVIKDGIKVAGSSDVLAAFVGDQVRGVAQPVQVNNEPVFFLTVHGNVNSEVVTFKLYDATADATTDITRTISFLGNAIIGQPSNPLQFVSETEVNDPVTWTVNPANFSLDMQVVARVRIDGVELNDPNALIAAFVGSEVRGVASPSASSLALFHLTVYANDESETVTMRVSSPANDTVFAVANAFEFASGTQLGDENTPFGVDGGSTTDVRPDFTANPLILGAYPVPAKDRVVFSVDARQSGSLRLSIFDIRGRLVATPRLEAALDEQTISWDTVDARGNQLPAGIYVAVLASETNVTSRTIVIVR